MAIYSRGMGGSLVESFVEELLSRWSRSPTPKLPRVLWGERHGKTWGWVGESGEMLHHQLIQPWADWIYTRVMASYCFHLAGSELFGA